MSLPAATVIVPVLDEIEHFDSALATVLAQRYDGALDFVFVDGGSTDGTRERLAELAAGRADSVVIDNPRPGIPVSLNLGLAAVTGEVLVRMDAHTRYGDDYVARGVAALVAGKAEWVAGPALARGGGVWSRWVAEALASRLGVGGADFRLAGEEKLTDAAFGGALWRERLRELGGWDEAWEVNEDGELAARATRAGWRILLDPGMAGEYIPRDDLRELARQYWRYGFWRAKTSVAYPESVRPSHAVPPLLVLTLCVALLPFVGRFARLGLVIYAAVLAVESARTAARAGAPAGGGRVAAVLATMHISWGAASLAGFARFGSPLPALGAIARALLRRAG